MAMIPAGAGLYAVRQDALKLREERRAAGIPDGVTVRKAGEDKPARSGPRNLLERAAQLDSVDQAALLIQTALGITTGDLAGLHLDEPRRWRRIDPATRLRQLAAWLRAECFECMDLVETSAPMQTVRTND